MPICDIFILLECHYWELKYVMSSSLSKKCCCSFKYIFPPSKSTGDTLLEIFMPLKGAG